ncbi:hypothetical protein C2E23DRAFT_700243, partial [Lenzites betulinus]
LNIVSDSKFVVDGLTRHAPRWEDRGWLAVAHAALIRDTIARLRARSAPTTFRWVKGHSGVPGNDGADRLACAGALTEVGAGPTLPPPRPGFVAQGVRLSALTQRLAYKTIRGTTGVPPRRRTNNMIGRVLAALGEWDCHPTAAALWRAIRAPEFRRGMRDFWWKALHDAHRVGEYWAHIPTYEHRAQCGVCGTVDSLEHILLECTAPGQREVWMAARATLERAGVALPPLSLGLVLGAPAFRQCADRSGPSPTGERLTRLIISESAHLIWRLRNRRVVGGVPAPPEPVTGEVVVRTWLAAINRRLLLDRLLTAPRLGKAAIPRSVVLSTWDKVIADRAELPDDWICCARVLVG